MFDRGEEPLTNEVEAFATRARAAFARPASDS